MKFTSIFFTASAYNLRGLPQRYTRNEREIWSLLQYFSQRVHTIFEVYLKDSKKWARNMKITSIFFTASTRYHRGNTQRHLNLSNYRFYQSLISIVYYRVFEHCEVYLSSLFGSVAHALADNSDGYVVIASGRSPTMTWCVWCEFATHGQHHRESFQLSIVVIDCNLILVVRLCSVGWCEYRENIRR